MKYVNPRVLALSAASVWAILFLLSASNVVAPAGSQIGARAKPPSGKHYPTPKELIESAALTDGSVGPFRTRTDNGAQFDWPGSGRLRPLVLVFLKRDCPCNVEFEPFFRRLEEQYGDVADFAGVIDSDVAAARSYAAANHLSHRVLADPGCMIIAQLHAKSGGYVALLRPPATIDVIWPGCSADMIRDIGRRIALLAKIDERSIDLTGLPRVLTTGCPFSS